MTTRRRLLVFGLLAVLLVLGGGVWLLWPDWSAITPDNAAKIHVGMTLTEVETILGAQAGDYRTNQQTPGPGPAFVFHETEISWHSDVTYIVVDFDERGHVKHLSYTRRAPEPILGKVRRWLRL